MIEVAKTTSGLYTLSAGKVGQLKVPLPDLEVQRTAIQRLERNVETALSPGSFESLLSKPPRL